MLALVKLLLQVLHLLFELADLVLVFPCKVLYFSHEYLETLHHALLLVPFVELEVLLSLFVRLFQLLGQFKCLSFDLPGLLSDFI